MAVRADRVEGRKRVVAGLNTLVAEANKRQSPIVEDQKFDASQALEEPSVMTVAACKRERIEESRQTLIVSFGMQFWL
jgi:hypothetical protein